MGSSARNPVPPATHAPMPPHPVHPAHPGCSGTAAKEHHPGFPARLILRWRRRQGPVDLPNRADWPRQGRRCCSGLLGLLGLVDLVNLQYNWFMRTLGQGRLSRYGPEAQCLQDR
jgi:hypothetical protein